MTNFDHSQQVDSAWSGNPTAPRLQNNQNETSPFDHIDPNHLAEWRESSVDDQLIALNLLSLKGTEPLEHLFSGLPNSCRRNDGRVRDYLLARYAHTETGGWWVSGLDPKNNWQEWDWGRFKPDEPRVDSKGKTVKYESPPKTDSHVTYFKVPQHIWDKVAKRYRIKRYRSRLTLRLADKLKPKPSHSSVESKHTTETSKTEVNSSTQQQKEKSTSTGYSLTATGEKQSLSDCLRHGIKPVPFLPLNLQFIPDLEELLYCFWEWVKDHPEIPIVLTEGEKKAASLLSLGFVAIALPGIWMGRVRDKETGLDYLHPDLMPMAHPKRKFVILFDNDPKPSTRIQVQKAILYTGKVIEAAGAKCEVATLPEGSEKGVDDYVTANGKKAKSLILKILKTALAFKDFVRRSRRRKWVLSDKYPPNIVVNTRYLGDAVQNLPDSGLVVLWSEMGTGKTELLRRFREAHPEERFLNIGHRVNLMQNLSPRLQTILYSEIAQGNLASVKALSITLDSLYKLETQLNKYGCVFIDEACQNLAHLLHSKTCKEHRAEILEILEYIVRSAKLVVIADAHMNDTTVDFFRAMRSADETPFIIKNEYKNAGREVYLYEGDNSSALVAKISSALMLGLKIMVVSDSKKFIKKLEALMNVQIMEEHSLFGNDESETSDSKKLRVWSIHADNSGSEENKVFIKDISNQVKDVDLLAASPSLGTGVDIKDYHFDVVFGAFHAVSQSATECVQALHRYRPLVPLHIWVAPRPPFGYKETRPWVIKEQMLELNQMTAFLIRIDQKTGIRGAEKDWALDAYCQIEAQRNESINNLRDDMVTLLEDMAYKITNVEVETDAVVKTMLSEAGKYLDATHRLAVVGAATINSAEYLARQTKEYLSPEEVVECDKYRIERDYGMPVTEELVKLDADGLLISRLIVLESLIAPSEGEVIDPKTGRQASAPPKIVVEKDLRERDNLPLCMDWHNYSSKWLTYQLLGFPKILMRLLAGEEITASDPDVMRMNQNALLSRAHVKSILNLTVRSDCLEKPLWLMGKFLERVGLKTALRKKGRRGEQVTYRSLDTESLSFAIEVLQYRSEQRMEKAKKERERQEKSAQRQAYMQSMYGIEPPDSYVSTSPNKRDVYKLEGDMDTKDNPCEKGEFKEDDTLKNLQLCLDFLEGIIDDGFNVLTKVLSELLRSGALSFRLLKGLSKYIVFLSMEMNEG